MPRGPTVLTLYSAADLLTGPGCAVCRYAAEAGDRYLAWFALEAHADAVTITRLGLRALDPWAGHVTAGGALEHADMLIAELNEAFSKNTWAHRHGPWGPEMTVWRRAAAFLDGAVFRGCPPRET